MILSRLDEARPAIYRDLGYARRISKILARAQGDGDQGEVTVPRLRCVARSRKREPEQRTSGQLQGATSLNPPRILSSKCNATASSDSFAERSER